MDKNRKKTKKHKELMDRLTFGKYNGSHLKAIIDSDLDYILWLLEKDIIRMMGETREYFEYKYKEREDFRK